MTQIPGQLDIYGNIEPEPPAQKHSDTSKAAAHKIKGEARSFRQQVLDALRKHGPMTDTQIAERTGINENTSRPRRIELCRNGQVKAVGKFENANGNQATLWGATTQNGEAL